MKSAQTIALLDDSTVTLRPVQSDDGDRLRSLFERVSKRSLYLRFHHQVMRLSEEDIRGFTDIDYASRFGVVATVGDGVKERVVGMGHYYRLDPRRAEVAFLVDDAYQGLGIATHILDTLMEVAREHGIGVFEAFVLGENQAMMEVFQACGFPLRTTLRYGTLFVEFPILPTCRGRKRPPSVDSTAA